MDIIETHCHLDYLKAKELGLIIEDCKLSSLSKILTIAVSSDNLDTVRELSNNYDMVYYTQGIHPHQADQFDDQVSAKIRKRINDKKMLAVGEIGLDYYYDKSPREIQMHAFRSQLEIAVESNMPVVIHSREADEDMIAVLNEYAPRLQRKGVIHSFTSGEKLASVALAHDFYLGFNGIITFKNAQNVRDILKLCPLEKMLVETDSPFLGPIPFRGKENTPANLPYILQKIADEKKCSLEHATKVTTQNALDLFTF